MSEQDFEILGLFESQEEGPEEHDKSYLGDPLYYTKIVLSNPQAYATQEFLKIYKDHFGVDTSDPEKLVAFWQSDEFLDWYSEYDMLLFFERFLGQIVKPFHVEWAQIISRPEDAAVLAPRDHGKSRLFTVNYSIWLAFYQKVKDILVVSETAPQARRLISGSGSIKEQITNNLKLSHLIPSVRGSDAGAWSTAFLKLKNGVSIKGIGFGSRSRGEHPDRIILDDVLSDQNCMTQELREKGIKYFAETIVPMKKKTTKILLVGTAQHQDDLMHFLGRSKSYFFRKYQAVNEITGDVLWPEKHDKEFFEDYKNTFGNLSFMKEYQNNPMDDSLSLFPEHVFTKALNPQISYLPSYSGPDQVALGADFSPPGGNKKGDGDYTVYLAGIVTDSGKVRIAWFDRFRDKPDSKELFSSLQMDKLEAMCTSFNVQAGYAESVGFQSIYVKDHIQRRKDLPIEAIYTTRQSKADLRSGIPYIRSLMESGMLELPYKTVQDIQMTHLLLSELKGVSKDDEGKIVSASRHDDMVIALWLMVEASKKLVGFGKDMTTIPRPRAPRGRHPLSNRPRIRRR